MHDVIENSLLIRAANFGEDMMACAHDQLMTKLVDLICKF